MQSDLGFRSLELRGGEKNGRARVKKRRRGQGPASPVQVADAVCC